MSTPESPAVRQLLFTDFRHILCADIEWYRANAQRVPLIDPPQPMVDVFAGNQLVPHGVRLIAQKAIKTEPFAKPGGLSRIVYDGGVYRTWFSRVEYPPGRD